MSDGLQRPNQCLVCPSPHVPPVQSTCHQRLSSLAYLSHLDLRSFPSHPPNYFPCPARNWAKRTGYSLAFRPVLRVNMRLSTSTASSFFALVKRNFGDSGSKKRVDAAMMLGTAFRITNIRHGLKIRCSQGRSKVQAWGIISHAIPENGRYRAQFK